MTKLILFDIDGTLVGTGGAGTNSMNLAFDELFDIRDAFKDIPMAGKTDIQIIKEGLRFHGLSYVDGNVDRMINGYIKFLRQEIDNPHKHLKPGIKESLESQSFSNAKNWGEIKLSGRIEKGRKLFPRYESN